MRALTSTEFYLLRLCAPMHSQIVRVINGEKDFIWQPLVDGYGDSLLAGGPPPRWVEDPPPSGSHLHGRCRYRLYLYCFGLFYLKTIPAFHKNLQKPYPSIFIFSTNKALKTRFYLNIQVSTALEMGLLSKRN